MYSTRHSKPQSKQNSDPLQLILSQQITPSIKMVSWRQIKSLLWRRLAFKRWRMQRAITEFFDKAAVWVSASKQGLEQRRRCSWETRKCSKSWFHTISHSSVGAEVVELRMVEKVLNKSSFFRSKEEHSVNNYLTIFKTLCPDEKTNLVPNPYYSSDSKRTSGLRTVRLTAEKTIE